jgi:hypothetical protein
MKKTLIHKRFFKRSTFVIMVTAFLLINAGVGVSRAQFESPTSSHEFAQVLDKIATLVRYVGIPVLIFFLILSGILFVTAQGNEEKLKHARTMLMWTAIGGVIIVGAPVIAEAIANFAGSLTSGS